MITTATSRIVCRSKGCIGVAQSAIAIARHQQKIQCIHHVAPRLSPTKNDNKIEDETDNRNQPTDNTPLTTSPVQIHNKSPIVQQLWQTRDDAKRRVMGKLTMGDAEYSDVSLAAAQIISDNAKTSNNNKEYTPPAKSGKHPRESAVGIAYLFSTDDYLLETYKNPYGEMRFGKIIEDLDALAGNIAFNHVEGNPLIVTAGVDRIRIRRRPDMDQRANQYLSGKVTWVGSSSMEIRMRISESESCSDGDGGSEWLEAYFTFVTLHPETKKSIKISPLKPETNEERVHFELGAVKANNKKTKRRNQLQLGRPLSEESLKIDEHAAKLLDMAGPLLRMPSLADSNTVLMDQTAQSNAMVAQPQARNLHDRIFGGFLMRRAFELAFATAYMFGGDKPRFLEVDDISFDKPVDVGDLLVFKSRGEWQVGLCVSLCIVCIRIY